MKRTVVLNVAMFVVAWFVAAHADEPPPKYETGDPRALQPNEVHAVWETLANVTVAEDDGMPADLPTPDSQWSPVDRSRLRVRYGQLSDYVAERHAEMAHELGLRAWTVDFTGGPLNLWYDIGTTRGARVPRFLIDGRGVFLNCVANEGRLLFLVLPQAKPDSPSERTRRIAALMPHDARFPQDNDGVPRIHAMRVIGGPHFEHEYALFGRKGEWWADWGGVEFEHLSPQGPIAVPAEGTVLLDLRIAETDLPRGVKPRTIRLRIRAKPHQPHKENAQ